MSSKNKKQHSTTLCKRDFSESGLEIGMWDRILEAFGLPENADSIEVLMTYEGHEIVEED